MYYHIGNEIESATLDQVEAITKALAHNQEFDILRDVFYYLLNNINNFPDLNIYKEKMKKVVKSLSSNQFMALLYIKESSEYQRQQEEIREIPLQSIIKWKTEFSFPDQFIDGCQKLIQYSKDIQPEVVQEIKEHGTLCD